MPECDYFAGNLGGRLSDGAKPKEMLPAMIMNSESIELDRVNHRIYKFQALVLGEGEGIQVQARSVTAESSSVTSKQPGRSEWKNASAAECVQKEQTRSQADKDNSLQRNIFSRSRKRSKTGHADELDLEIQASAKERVSSKSPHSLHEEVVYCQSCRQRVLDESDCKWSSLMEKPKEELVAMVMSLQDSLPKRERKMGYCPPKDGANLFIKEVSSDCLSTEATSEGDAKE